MNRFSILTNRKRTIIALVHSIAFLLIAAVQSAGHRNALSSLHGGALIGGYALLGTYVVVTAVLLWLGKLSRGIERTYFAFCVTSAGTGLLRTIFGDHALHGGQYLRVIMLIFAVFTCTFILRLHSQQESVMAD